MKLNRILLAMALGAVSETSPAAEKEITMKLSSPSFTARAPIPAKFTCNGEDVSPALQWDGVPAGTKSLALICDDPDAMSVAGKVWVHWVAWGIPATQTALPENASKTIKTLQQGITDFGRTCWGGPSPPPRHGVHHYYFKLYALDTEPSLPSKATKKQLEGAMKGHILAQAELIGTFERN